MAPPHRRKTIIQLTVDPYVVEQIDSVAGPRGRSRWVENACRAQLRRVAEGFEPAGLFDDNNEPVDHEPVTSGPEPIPVIEPYDPDPVVPATVLRQQIAEEKARRGLQGVSAARAALHGDGDDE